VLLRDALIESGKIAIALVVIRARQHLAAAKPKKKGLMLELMHFPEELLDVSEFKKPVEKPSTNQRCRWQSSSSKA
jgi:DNA end-binding protein Ku